MITKLKITQTRLLPIWKEQKRDDCQTKQNTNKMIAKLDKH